jgi:hypothetical protein
MENAFCGKCGWPVIHCCANGPMSGDGDYFIYCSDKECPCHAGEYMNSGGDWPEFVKWMRISLIVEDKV